MQYIIITAPDFEELVGRVNAHIRDGWSISGGPIVLPKRITTVRKDGGTVDEYTNGHVECIIGQAITRDGRGPTPHGRGPTPPRQRKVA